MRRAVARAVGVATYPLWAAASRISSFIAQLATEIPAALYSPQVADAMLRRYYGGEARYREASKWHRILFPFEIRMLEKFFPAPPAHLLLHGAGSGRELTALLALGYRVTAFEPVQALADAGNRLLGPSNSPIQCAAVQDWDRWRSDSSYDAVFTGWGMWTHLVRQQDRLEALIRFREVCPAGPVLLSFFNGQALFDEYERGDELLPLHPSPRGTLQRLTRYWLRQRILRMAPLERGTAWGRGAYYHGVRPSELKEEAASTGWRVAYYDRNPLRFPHAVLLTAAPSRAAA